MKIESFGSRRDQHNAVLMLSKGEEDITLPRERLIKQAISELSKDTSRRNVKFLLDVAENNKYGSAEQSGLSSYMAQNSTLAEYFPKREGAADGYRWLAISRDSKKGVQNTDWNKELQIAIKAAIEKMPKNQSQRFINRYNSIFMQQKDLTEAEKQLVALREEILSSKVFTQESKKSVSKKAVAEAMRNLDYFIISSETPIKERIYVLSKLAHFMSDEYKINEQLKNKKFQAFSEMINDLVVRTPNDKERRLKAVDQKFHGSCMAISIARKTLADSDKRSYVDMVMSEIDDNPYMEIYDVTRMIEPKQKGKAKKTEYGLEERAPKVKTEKAHINYDKALKDGYRIVDASVLNWMKIAGTVSDGSINLEDYFAFDARHNGLMHDSRVIKSADESYAKIHDLLRVLIKANRLHEAYKQGQANKKIKELEYGRSGLALGQKKDQARLDVRNIVAEITKSKDLTKDLNALNFIVNYLANEKHVNVSNNDKVMQSQVAEQLRIAFSKMKQEETKNGRKTDLTLPSGEKLHKEAEKLVLPLKAYKKAEREYNAVTSTRMGKIAEAKRIFEIGVADRQIIQMSAELENNTNSLYDELNLPDRAVQIHNEVHRLQKLLAKKPNSQIITDIKKKNHLKTNQGVAKMLEEADNDLSVNLPNKMDKLLSIFGQSYSQNAANYLRSQVDALENGDEKFILEYASKHKRPISPKKFTQQLNSDIRALSQPQSCAEVNKIMSKYFTENVYSSMSSIITDLVDKTVELYENEGFNATKKVFDKKYAPQTEEELQILLDKLSYSAVSGTKRLEEIATKINYPSEQEVVLRGNEKKGLIATQAELNDLRQKFDQITKIRTADNDETIKNKSKQLNFTPQQRATLAKIEKAIPKNYHDNKRSYRFINESLSKQLDDLYSDVGKRKGMFWISEEGHSGMYTSEGIRILEQMTGRPYYQELDFDEAVDAIKKGKRTAASSSMVEYDDYSGHAQYIADVRPFPYRDTQTGEIKQKDAILHDNSWGQSEKNTNSHFIDEDSILRVNYGKNYGGPRGFLADESGLTGEYVDDYKYDYGTKESKVFPYAISGPQTEVFTKSEFPILRSTMIEGLDPRLSTKIEKLMDSFVMISAAKYKINNLFSTYAKVAPSGKINFKEIDAIETGISRYNAHMSARMQAKDGHRLTLEEFNRLPKDDELKLIINKIIVAKAFGVVGKKHIKEAFEDIHTNEELQDFKEEHLEQIKDNLVPKFVKSKETNKYFVEIVMDDFLEKNKLAKQYNLTSEDFGAILTKSFNETIEKKDNGSARNLYNIVKETLDKEFATVPVETATKDTETTQSEIKNLSELPNFRQMPLEDRKKLSAAFMSELKKELYPSQANIILKDPKAKELVNFVDNIMKPADNEELVSDIHKLSDMTREQFNKILEKATFADFGIKFDSPENIIKLYHAGNELVQDRFDDMVRYQYFGRPNVRKIFDFTPEAEAKLIKLATDKKEQQLASLKKDKFEVHASVDNKELENVEDVDILVPLFNIAYRNAKLELSTVSIDKILKKHKQQIFDKYKCRPALPNIQAVPDEKIHEFIDEDINMLSQHLYDLRTNIASKKQFSILDNADAILQDYQQTHDKKAILDYLESLNDNTKRLGGDAAKIEEAIEYAEALVLQGAPAEIVEAALSNIKETNSMLMQGQNANSFDEGIKQIKENISMYKQTIIAQTLPEHQNMVAKDLKTYIDLFTKDPDSNETDDQREYLTQSIITYHVLKDPEKFLPYALKTSVDEKIKPHTRNKITEKYKELLSLAYIEAGRATTEFILMEMAEKGIASKIKDVIQNLGVGLRNENGKTIMLNSTEGIEQIIDLLGDVNNNHSTLMLFMEHAGLIDSMLKAIYAIPKKEYKKEIDAYVNTLFSVSSGKIIMQKHVAEFLKTIPESIQYKDEKQLRELYEKFEETLQDSQINEPIYAAFRKAYTANLQEIIKCTMVMGNPPVATIFASITNSLNDMVNQNINNLGASLNNYLLYNIQSKIKILENVRLKEGSPDDIKRHQMIQEYEDLIKYAQNQSKKASKNILRAAMANNSTETLIEEDQEED